MVELAQMKPLWWSSLVWIYIIFPGCLSQILGYYQNQLFPMYETDEGILIVIGWTSLSSQKI